MSDAAVAADLPPLDDDALSRIAGLVYRHTGIRLGPGKGYFVVGRLQGLFRSLGCVSWGDLPRRLEGDPRRIETLIQSVVTGETSFFRDEAPFAALRDKIVPEFVEGTPPPAPFRVWSAGCSTGQEPYSIVMALWDRVERGELDLQVWATDICGASLAKAREGVYEPLELRRGVEPEVRSRYFEDGPRGVARVREALRGRVRFESLNLMRADPGRQFHAVYCRNVAIYFDREGKQRVYQAVGRAVVPGGYLILGAAETLFPGVPGFETVYFGRSLLFRRQTGEPR